jgi:hypothetical protein
MRPELQAKADAIVAEILERMVAINAERPDLSPQTALDLAIEMMAMDGAPA